MELLQRLGFCQYIAINTEKCWDLIMLDVDQVLVWQVLQQYVAPVSPVVRETVQDTLLLLHCFRGVCLPVILLVVLLLLILDELVVTILFIVLDVRGALCIAI